MSNALHRRTKRVRFAPIAIGTGALAAILLSVTMSGSLAGFTAQITNSNDTALSGALVMQEQNNAGTVSCASTDATGGVSNNAFSCTTINKYGGQTMLPGQTVSTTIKINNTGSVAASTFTLTPGACTQSTNGANNGTATDLCSQMKLTVTDVNSAGGTTTPINNLSLTQIATNGAITLPVAAVGNTQTFTFAITFGASTLGNTYQGLQVSQPLVWTYNA